MSAWAYPNRCCCLRAEYGYRRLSYGACRSARDPDICGDCEDAKKRYLAAKRKQREKGKP